ncbi:unnamed protein product [Vitrella brassicaformis CCMP3155]|uniref:isoleucine--tRNA ligase n=4 Tax=Vitrella brassicaformis TaxID=1169539 RepID=A0A0G4EKC3_VITBC|nr:unnamed protein product [Vitrella brassicaformis CCMP3155]|eukprot:CEL97895.1 unnamed protein product [Vitrella brassicaformis CCMP3155]
MTTFHPVSDRVCFPEEEEKTLQYWQQIDAFKTSYQQSVDEGRPVYRFYDGPPFATGLPHYGHILAGTIKDVVTRYAHQSGYCVERRFGWDCHGLPVEHEIDKKLNVKSKEDVLAMGIGVYNEECRSIVMRYSKEWQQVIERMGRWIDFENDYKTLDISFMESVWWAFKQLFEKKLVYRAFKVMPYSTVLCTPLANFEVNQNYKDISDPSIIVAFPYVDESACDFLAWTTTPWTLPSNLALCVNPHSTYLRVKNKKTDREWVLMEARLPWVCKELKLDMDTDINIEDKFPGKVLEGIRYKPMFEYFNKGVWKEKGFRVITGDFVEETGGTGVVHCAPAFGEDDYKACVAFNIIDKESGALPCPVDANGRFTDEVPDYQGQNVKDADKDIRRDMKATGRLLLNANEVHSYPHCWRSDTPLIYRAVPCWFISVEKVKHDILKNMERTYWVPSFVKEKRFYNWVKDSNDWCVSRNRFWGTPIPLWHSDDWKEIVCIGSVAELEEKTGKKITDIHRHFIDDLKIPSSRPGMPDLKRIEEVFDCWFESGSMPYGQVHYPFENADKFREGFPADFIAEGLDQTRGWFYTLMVLSSALFDEPAFKNLICNGLVLAADGKKMSKRLKNYPDPMSVVNNHGADAIRLYLINSPVVRAEPLRFKEEGVRDVVKDIFLPWFNAYRFLLQEVGRYENNGGKFQADPALVEASDNVMDRWIYAATQHLIQYVDQEMKAYRLYTVAPKLVDFLEQLTNWYVRLNRDRMRGLSGADETITSLCTLYEVLMIITRLMAPFTPFLTEYLYQNLARALPEGHPDRCASVHWVSLPKANEKRIDAHIETRVARMQTVIELGRQVREKRKVSLKTPVKEVRVIHADPSYIADIDYLQSYIKDELNTMELTLSTDASAIHLSAQANSQILGPKFGKEFGPIRKAVCELTHEQLQAFEETGEIAVCGHTLKRDELFLKRSAKDIVTNPNLEADGDNSVLVVVDFTSDDSLQTMALAREVANRVQKMRKKAGLSQDDPVDMWATPADLTKAPNIQKVLTKEREYLHRCLRRQIFDGEQRQGHEVIIYQEDVTVNGEDLRVEFTLSGIRFNEQELRRLAQSIKVESSDGPAKANGVAATAVNGVDGDGTDGLVTAMKGCLLSYEVEELKQLASSNNGSVTFNIEGAGQCVLIRDKHWSA